MELDKLPKPDGAPFTCTMSMRINEWPYVTRCSNAAVGMLTWPDFDKVTEEFSLGGRMVCEMHADHVARYLEAVK